MKKGKKQINPSSLQKDGNAKTDANPGLNALKRWIKRLRNSRLIACCKKIYYSLPSRLLRAFALVLCLVYLVFLIKPDIAHVYSELDILDSSLEFSAKRVELSGLTQDHITVQCLGDLMISLSTVAINGKQYKMDDWLLIKHETISSVPFSELSFRGKVDSAYVIECTNDTLCDSVLRGVATGFKANGKQIVEYTGKTYVLDQNKTETELDLGGKFEIEYNVRGDDSPYDLVVNVRDVKTTLKVDFSDVEKLTASDVVSIDAITSGSVRFSYTPDAKEYELKTQEILLQNHANNQKNSLSFNMDNRQKKMVVYGYIYSAQISKMTLFPEFKNWFFSNAYLAPVTILTSVFSAIKLLKKPNEKEEKEK